jgi:ketosteroid isomerase-like protein
MTTMFIDHDHAVAFAQDWIDAWNAGDLDRILSHYADDFEMSSPLIRERMGVESGSLKGKDAIRPYWAIGLAAQPPLRFELVDVAAGVNAVAIYYRNLTRKHCVVEHLCFGGDGLVRQAQALHSVGDRTTD